MKKDGFFLRLICIAAALAAFVFTGGCTVPTIELCTGSDSDPQKCFEDFILHLNSGEFEEADGYLYNYETLGFAVPSGDTLYQKVFGDLQRSRRGVVLRTISQDGNKAVIEVELTSLDCRTLENVLAQLTSEQARENQMDGMEITDDSQIKQIMSDCYDRLMQNPQDQYTTAVFQLELVKVDGRWLIVCTEEFYSALIGYAM